MVGQGWDFVLVYFLAFQRGFELQLEGYAVLRSSSLRRQPKAELLKLFGGDFASCDPSESFHVTAAAHPPDIHGFTATLGATHFFRQLLLFPI